MSVPAELMDVMAGGGGKGTPPGPGPLDQPQGANQAPAGGPMSTPQPKEGLEQSALINIAMVFQLLEQSLGAFGSPTPKGKAILSALKGLTTAFGDERQKSEGLIPAELMQLTQAVPGAGGGPAAAKAMGGMQPGKPAIPQGA